MFYDKFLSMCIKQNISPTAAANALGMTGAHVSRWKQGSTPTDMTIAKIAQYFGVDPEYFKDDSPKKNAIKKSADDGGSDVAREAIFNSPGLRALFDASKGVPDSRLYEAAAQLAKWKEETKRNAD